MKEKKTSQNIAKRLSELGIEVNINIGGTGVVGLLKGKDKGRTILLRADMDAAHPGR